MDELCTTYCEQYISHPFDDDAIKDSLSRLLSYFLISERNGVYVSLSLTEYMLQSHLKYAKPKFQDIPDIEIVNGVIRVRSADQVQK